MERNAIKVFCASERMKDVCDAVIRDYVIEYPKENVALEQLLGLLPSNKSLREYMEGFYIGDYLMKDMMLKILNFYKSTGRDVTELMEYARYNAENTKPLDRESLSGITIMRSIKRVDEERLSVNEQVALRDLKRVWGDVELMRSMFCSKGYNVYSLLEEIKYDVDIYVVLKELFSLQEWRDVSETRIRLIELLKKI